MDTDALRRIAEAASPGPWRHGCLPGIDRRSNRVYTAGWTFVLDADMEFEDALHIATFDPQMVGALLDVAEHAAALRLSTPEYVDEAQHRLSESLDALDALTERT